MRPALRWRCPHCAEPLDKVERSYRCANGHCFDEAKEGYVNLLPANRKRSREPGDNRDMVDARKRIHAAEIYRPLAEAVVAVMAALPAASRVVDLGCGEGYYSGGLQRALPGLALWGIDIAKPAVRLAAKAIPDGQFAVASSYDVPLEDACMDAAFTVFAPTAGAELARLVRSGGLFLNVCPAAGHLWQLRELLYENPRPHQEQMAAIEGFAPESEQRVTFNATLDATLLEDLVAMTPYAYGGQRENKARLEKLDKFEVQMDFLLQRYRREAVA